MEASVSLVFPSFRESHCKVHQETQNVRDRTNRVIGIKRQQGGMSFLKFRDCQTVPLITVKKSSNTALKYSRISQKPCNN